MQVLGALSRCEAGVPDENGSPDENDPHFSDIKEHIRNIKLPEENNYMK